jgi:hypothetical protein
MKAHAEKFRRLFAVALLALATISPASAALIQGLYDTGVLNDGTAAASGSADLHYTLVASADPSFPGPDAIVADPIANGYWLVNTATSRWIGPAQNQGYPSGAATHAAGDYTYRLTFDLTGLDPATAQITGGWAADNKGVAIWLNGVNTGHGAGSYNPLTSFTLSSGFLAGLNTLDFVVNNFSAGGANPTGLRVQGLTGTAAAVPVPAAGWLFPLGLAAVARLAKRRA